MIATYCGRHTAVEAVEWKPDVKLLAQLVTWTGGRVKMAGKALLLQTPDLIEQVPEGHYIVRVNDDAFYVYSPEDFQDVYARVEAQAV